MAAWFISLVVGVGTGMLIEFVGAEVFRLPLRNVWYAAAVSALGGVLYSLRIGIGSAQASFAIGMTVGLLLLAVWKPRRHTDSDS